MDWQPIETAPKDGTRLLVFCPEFEGEPRVMEARAGGPYMMLVGGSWGDPVYGEWECEPTHWMPLPPPPTAAE